MREPEPRYETREAIDSLAKELQLHHDERMQDWSYEIANPGDVERYIEHYKVTVDEDKKFVLMQIIIQAVNDQPDENSFLKYWDRIKGALIADLAIHEYTVFYWCLFNDDDNDIWTITPRMREIWNSHHSVR
ncbi:MAG TPA: hypothetical protein VGK59_18180 [Ohtaekwangia sp.]